MKKQLILATTNRNKVFEMKDHLSSFFDEILSLSDVGLNIDVEETGLTFLENSKIKALDISLKTSIPVLADDSGLSIDALNGFPGLYSARFMEDSPYEEKCNEILKMMKDKGNREANYTCAITYIDKENKVEKQFVGICYGKIIDSYTKGKYGFGYDPIFYSYEAKDIFSNIKEEEKFKYSHRGKAIREFLSYLKGN